MHFSFLTTIFVFSHPLTLPLRGSVSGPPSGRCLLKNPHCNKYQDRDTRDGTVITDLVETVSDEREDEETSEGGQEPDPPGDAGLAWLAGDDGGGDAVGLNTAVSDTQESLTKSYLESQMSLVN